MKGKGLRHLRLMPVNQVALLKLRVVGEAEDPDTQPVFQFMNWGIASGIPLTHRHTERVLEQLMSAPDQDWALDYLLNEVSCGLLQLNRSLLRLKPRPAAQLLLDVLDMRLKADPRTPYPAEPTGS